MPISRQRRALRGFSLIELVIAITILAVLVGVVAMRSGGLVSKSKAAAVTQLVDTLKTAAVSYHGDTGQMPWEYSGGTATNRKLSGTQTIAGWHGPYIEKPLSAGSNPFGGSINLYATPTVNGGDGFDIDGDGALDVTTAACTLWLTGVTQADAEMIDATLDKGLPGTWTTGGRVEWNAANQQMWILVYW